MLRTESDVSALLGSQTRTHHQAQTRDQKVRTIRRLPESFASYRID